MYDERLIHWLPVAVPLLAVLLLGCVYLVFTLAI
jgi:hypothetical protein